MRSEIFPKNSPMKPTIVPDIAPLPIMYQSNPSPLKTEDSATMKPMTIPIVKPPQTAFRFLPKTTNKMIAIIPNIFQTTTLSIKIDDASQYLIRDDYILPYTSLFFWWSTAHLSNSPADIRFL